MVQLRTVCRVRDNSGAKWIRVFHVKGIQTKRAGTRGCSVVASVLRAGDDSSRKKGDVVRAFLVTSKTGRVRPSGRVVRFPENGCLLVNSKGDPIGTRIVGPLPADLRRLGRAKALSRATHTV